MESECVAGQECSIDLVKFRNLIKCYIDLVCFYIHPSPRLGLCSSARFVGGKGLSPPGSSTPQVLIDLSGLFKNIVMTLLWFHPKSSSAVRLVLEKLLCRDVSLKQA